MASTEPRRRAAAVASRAALLVAVLTLGACAATPSRGHAPCQSGEQRMQRDALYFGTARPDGGVVSAADWQGFVREVLTPAFPAGFSVYDAAGHWRGADGVGVSEASHVVVVLHADDAASERAIGTVVATYRQRYAQESVLRERVEACARF